ncbi:outer membrane beta-barrel protein [uncultured Arenimonas sp.]|uniref:outer membrane beta-barrel protein n=1 Tax=uncultured Arenimonas sp. TaxID=546226 RepID=UPI0030DC34DD
MKNSILAIALLAASASAGAAELDYSYVQVEYIHLAEAYDVELDGAGVRGSVELGDQWYLTGEYANTQASEFGIDLDVDTFAIGVGHYSPISDTAHFIGEVSALSGEAEILGYSDSDYGYRAGFGVRWLMGANVEGSATGNYTSYREIGSGFHANLGLHWKFSKNFGLVAEYQHGEIVEGLGESRYSVGLRARF